MVLKLQIGTPEDFQIHSNTVLKISERENNNILRSEKKGRHHDIYCHGLENRNADLFPIRNEF